MRRNIALLVTQECWHRGCALVAVIGFCAPGCVGTKQPELHAVQESYTPTDDISGVFGCVVWFVGSSR